MIRHKQQATLFSASIAARPTRLLLSVVAIVVLAIAQRAEAQNYHVIYNFTGVEDGSTPYGALTIDASGHLYGASPDGGNLGGDCPDLGCGTIFELSNNGSRWVFSRLYAFAGGADGAFPYSSLIPGPGNALYGTTLNGGIYANDGTVFTIKPAANVCGPPPCWTHTVIHDFLGTDGSGPAGDVIFDQTGNLYGTTVGGTYTYGTVYQLVPSGRTWTLSTLYQFPSPADGAYPWAGVIMDSAGDFYGVTFTDGAYGWGTVFELVPSGAGWEKITLHDFTGGDGRNPLAALIFDHSGDLIGTTTLGGGHGGGTVFQLTPSGDSWTFSTLYSFSGAGGPDDRLAIDTAGNLYGTTYQDGPHNLGTVFKLSPSGQGWSYTSLQDFTGGSDGNQPLGGVSFDRNGNIYGTAQGGTYQAGLVFQITP
jgi:uncharacterized repeat protein (TIGR03803 family)